MGYTEGRFLAVLEARIEAALDGNVAASDTSQGVTRYQHTLCTSNSLCVRAVGDLMYLP